MQSTFNHSTFSAGSEKEEKEQITRIVTKLAYQQREEYAASMFRPSAALWNNESPPVAWKKTYSRILTDWLIRNTISTSDLAFNALLQNIHNFACHTKLAIVRPYVSSSSLQMPFFMLLYYFVFHFNLLFCLFIIFSSILLQTNTKNTHTEISFSAIFSQVLLVHRNIYILHIQTSGFGHITIIYLYINDKSISFC